jgi:hypothetical protein
VGIDSTQNSLWQRDVDSRSLVAKLAGIDIDDSAGPTAIVALLLQLFNRGWRRECLPVSEQSCLNTTCWI